MNINPDKVKELVLLFSKLDDEYQNRLLAEAFKLQFMQIQKQQIIESGITFDSEEEFENYLNNQTTESWDKVLKLGETFEKVNATEKASIYMKINQLIGCTNMEDVDISITIDKKEISMKEYLEKYLPEADYDEAKEILELFKQNNE